MAEFDIIKRFFTGMTAEREDVLVGVGDDCALLAANKQSLAVSMDTLVSGVHFYPDTDPKWLGHKALAVNLSDLAATGATPAWATLSLTLPKSDDAWLAAFSAGFAQLAKKYHVQLVGGDTTQGPLSITVQLHGHVPADRALLRSGAQSGDYIFVSGTLGDAALALARLKSGAASIDETLLSRLYRPEPRVLLGQLLTGIASSAIDISDGLASDLGHICTASGVAALIEREKLPLSGPMKAHLAKYQEWAYCLSGGDDYELCFSVPESKISNIQQIGQQLSLPLTAIGRIEAGQGIAICSADGRVPLTVRPGYEHFSDE